MATRTGHVNIATRTVHVILGAIFLTLLIIATVKLCEKDKILSPQFAGKLIQQRNYLSKLLNEKQKIIGRLECEKSLSTTQTGGWCRNQSEEIGGEHMTDTRLATALSDFFEHKSVGSFGEGPGRYRDILLNLGKVKEYDSYDGSPYCDLTSKGRVQFLDLTLPQYGLPMYDWGLSLEVAEHIPRQFEKVFVDNIVRHAKEGVVMSWAKIGQGGYHHINNRDFEYVQRLMFDFGFSHDYVASEKLRKSASLPWLKENINVFRRIIPI